MLDLWHWEPNTFSLKALIALHEKQLPFNSHYVDFLTLEQYSLAAFADVEASLSIEGEAPLLVHDGHVISDSFNLLQYLDDAFAEHPLQPADAVSRWRIQVWGRFASEVLAPAVCTLGCVQYTLPVLRSRERQLLTTRIAHIKLQERRDKWQQLLSHTIPEVEVADSRRKVGIAATKLETALQQSDWLCGASYSLADIDLFALTWTLPTLAAEVVNAERTPQLLRWLARINARPAVQASLAMSRSGQPQQAFAPGPEHARWG